MEENPFEKICKAISNRNDCWVRMKPIGEKGSHYYIVTEEYFNKIKDCYEKDSLTYYKNIKNRVINEFKNIFELINEDFNKLKEIDKTIKDIEKEND